MEFLLFISQHSRACAELLEQVPLLNEKTICVDSPECRTLLKQLPYTVERVPTLFITDGVRTVLKVIEGAQEIHNWFVLVSYSMGTAPSAPEEMAPPEIVEDDLMPPLPTNPAHVTPLDFDPMPTPQKSSLLKGNGDNVKNLAEQLQRERESFMDSTKV